nr:MAG TPA: hypothetical protein [Caudoviricetes sp.]
MYLFAYVNLIRRTQPACHLQSKPNLFSAYFGPRREFSYLRLRVKNRRRVLPTRRLLILRKREGRSKEDPSASLCQLVLSDVFDHILVAIGFQIERNGIAGRIAVVGKVQLKVGLRQSLIANHTEAVISTIFATNRSITMNCDFLGETGGFQLEALNTISLIDHVIGDILLAIGNTGSSNLLGGHRGVGNLSAAIIIGGKDSHSTVNGSITQLNAIGTSSQLLTLQELRGGGQSATSDQSIQIHRGDLRFKSDRAATIAVKAYPLRMAMATVGENRLTSQTVGGRVGVVHIMHRLLGLIIQKDQIAYIARSESIAIHIINPLSLRCS